MSRSGDIERRMRDMLTFDKVNVKEGYILALNRDVAKILGDYFVLSAAPEIHIIQRRDGAYSVEVCAVASRIKQFDTTHDVKRF